MRHLLPSLLLIVSFGCTHHHTAKRSHSKDASSPPSSPATQAAAHPVRVLLVRHGEAVVNVQHPADVTPAQLDSLTEKGQQQATELGQYLKGQNVVAVFTSPTHRTRQTADMIVKEAGLAQPAIADSNFAPLKPGTGPDGNRVTYESRRREWQAGHDIRPAGGESLQDGFDRASRELQAIAKKYPGDTVAVVTHGDIIAALLGRATGTPITQRFDQHNVPAGSVSELLVGPDEWKLIREGFQPGSRPPGAEAVTAPSSR